MGVDDGTRHFVTLVCKKMMMMMMNEPSADCRLLNGMRDESELEVNHHFKISMSFTA
jgi:hypothetical protein